MAECLALFGGFDFHVCFLDGGNYRDHDREAVFEIERSHCPEAPVLGAEVAEPGLSNLYPRSHFFGNHSDRVQGYG